MLIVLLATALALLVAYIKWNYTYWQRQGFPYVEPKIPFGVLDSVRTRERSMGMALYDIYKSTSERVIGIYLITRPALLVRDPQIVRNMLTKDFNSFHDRGIYVNEKRDPFSGNLFALRGKKWKNLRVTLTPTFTSGKLKAMFSTTEDVCDKMVNHLRTLIPEKGSVSLDLKMIGTTYAIDIIASVIFGLDVDSFKDPNNDFHMISKKVNTPAIKDVVRGTAQFLYPNLENFFIRLGWREEAAEEMKALVRRTIEMRERLNITRKDMLQMLLQVRNTGEVNKDDNEWSAGKRTEEKHMSIEMIAAQLFLFYIAGYETTASSISFTLYELSQYPELLAKAERDVEEALQKHEGKLTYDAIQDMKYLDLCLMETIRKYPGLPFLNRECTQDYPIPGSKLVIKKGTPIIISLFGMHRDSAYFPDALGYNPERFESQNYDPVAFMPFGEGPRHCIAQRMGKVNAKVALAAILTNFNVEPPAVRAEIEIDNFGVPIMPKGGVPVKISRKPATTA